MGAPWSLEDQVYVPRHPRWYGRWLLPSRVDLANSARWPFMPNVLNQGEMGTCTVHAAVNAYRFALAKEARQKQPYMPRCAEEGGGDWNGAVRIDWVNMHVAIGWPRHAPPVSLPNTCAAGSTRMQPHVHLLHGLHAAVPEAARRVGCGHEPPRRRHLHPQIRRPPGGPLGVRGAEQGLPPRPG